MIIASWNIRGFSKALKHNGVNHLIKKHEIDILGLLETKLALINTIGLCITSSLIGKW